MESYRQAPIFRSKRFRLFQKYHTMAIVAAGVGVASAGYSAYRGIHGAAQAKKAQNALEHQSTPTYTPNQAINSYYQNALTRYNTSPYNSSMYQVAKENANRTLGAGIGALRDRKSAIGGIGGLVALTDNSLQKAGAQAEGLRNQEFGQLGRAAAMRAGDDKTAFQYNQVMPYQRKSSLLQAQGIGGVNEENAGIQDFGSSVNNLGKLYASGAFKSSPSSAMSGYTGGSYDSGD